MGTLKRGQSPAQKKKGFLKSHSEPWNGPKREGLSPSLLRPALTHVAVDIGQGPCAQEVTVSNL